MGKRIGLVIFGVALLGALVAAPGMSYAGSMGTSGAKWTLSVTKDYTASPWTHEVGYANRALGKLTFGVKNLLLGWTELFTEPSKASSKGSSVLAGVGMGLKNAVEDELGGVVHLVTFPITELDAPLPEGGTSLMSK